MTIIKLRMSIETDAGEELQVYEITNNNGDMNVSCGAVDELIAGVNKTQEYINYTRSFVAGHCEDEDYED